MACVRFSICDDGKRDPVSRACRRGLVEARQGRRNVELHACEGEEAIDCG